MNYFDRALNDVLDGIERNVVDQVREAASAALEEYPSKGKAARPVRPADWSQAPGALQYWQSFDLEAQKGRLRGQLEQILTEKTSKDRSLQSLIRRAHEAEGAFKDICSTLLQAPDVVPLLYEGLGLHAQVQDLLKEKDRLVKDKEAAEKETSRAATVFHQVREGEEACSQAVARLEEEVAKNDRLQKELASTADIRRRCSQLATRASELEQSLGTLQAQHNKVQDELFELRSSRDSAASMETNAADAASEEQEQSLTRIRELEHELRRSNAKLAALDHASAATGSISSEEESALKREVRRLRSEVIALQQATKARAAEDVDGEREDHSLRRAEGRITELEEELDKCVPRQVAEELQSKLHTAETLLAAQMAADAPSPPQDQGSHAGRLNLSQPQESLVAVLQSRNRGLAAENSSLQQRFAEASRSLQNITESLATQKVQLDEKEALVKQLEQDIIDSSGHATEAGSEGQNRPDNTAAAQSGNREDQPGLLQVVTKQRDRFRKRTLDLEVEIGSLRKEAGIAAGKAKQLEQDNVGLFERIKFLQHYKKDNSLGQGKLPDPAAHSQASSSNHRMSCGPFQVQVGGGPRIRSRNARFSCLGGRSADQEIDLPKSELEQQYAKAYESNLNPFTDFQNSEREERLPTHERALLAGSKLMLSSRLGRVVSITYLAALHVFLFFLLYQKMLSSSSAHPGLATDAARKLGNF